MEVCAVSHRIKRAAATDLEASAATLAAAFDSYPWTRWSIPQDGYAERLERLQRLYLEFALQHGIVLVADEVRGVLALLPPDAPEPPPDFQQQVADLHGDRLEVLGQVDIPAQPENAWNLATLGVHPDSQGRGLGGALVEAGLAAVSTVDAAAGTALETSDERNVRLYERSGFTVTATTSIPDGPVVYSMFRPAAH
ncbi:GNAT family N-acetyltransferase [Mycolicibacterium neoaurum]|nr:GNAT family N-acetyltransferase [Mycolicibacterium neoaurum]MDO3403080.1 GNAT family N-acetyltransferase [Mycolicibacterium neoaurum]